ncbi:APC family permease [Maricaulis sp. MIT060901]|uniref:APC family permease n=1 Tax=Maricaulis sp. MIT060901 TaxID=3096993 RepID=UPI00399BA1FA
MAQSESKKSKAALGFWGCWSLTVGVMIGSGIFMLPTVLAPYGMMSMGGWALTAGGSIILALVLGRLAGRTEHSGGPYTYARENFGDLTGFLVVWGHWASYFVAIPAIAIAFVGYLAVFVPGLDGNATGQAVAALVLIWTLTLISIRGVSSAGLVQVMMTLLKLLPLLLIIGAGMAMGSTQNLPALNPSGESLLSVLAATALLTMWAFAGLEAGVIPAGDVENPKKTLPRAVVTGTIFTAVIYVGSTLAVMMLVPSGELVNSTSPFADAARALGSWGGPLVAIGAMIATAGSLNGNIFTAGQLPLAAAQDRLAPAWLGKLNGGHSPQGALILSSVLGSVLLVANYSRGLVGAFTFLLMMSTVCTLAPLLISALAEIKHSWRSARAWAVVALIGALYSTFAIWGSGLEVIGWGIVLLILGLPVYFLGRQR